MGLTLRYPSWAAQLKGRLMHAIVPAGGVRGVLRVTVVQPLGYMEGLRSRTFSRPCPVSLSHWEKREMWYCKVFEVPLAVVPLAPGQELGQEFHDGRRGLDQFGRDLGAVAQEFPVQVDGLGLVLAEVVLLAVDLDVPGLAFLDEEGLGTRMVSSGWDRPVFFGTVGRKWRYNLPNLRHRPTYSSTCDRRTLEALPEKSGWRISDKISDIEPFWPPKTP